MTARPTSDPALPAPHVLRDYALLADGERGVLVGPDGEFVWMCFPRWDSDAVFSSLIGGTGTYAITPRERCVWGGYYEPDTLIWRSRWITADSVIECRQALAAPARPHRAVILRRVIARHGAARVRITLAPRAHFGHGTLGELARAEDGTWRARTADIHLTWTGARDARPGDETLSLTLDVPEGAHHDLVLVLSTDAHDGAAPEPDRAWAGTRAHWRERIPGLQCAGAAQRDARHAYAVLDGLTSAGGGTVAAATTSLPERARQGRNYDYRYVWIRDQCYAGQAVAASGPHPLLDGAVRFVRDRLLADGATLRPAYTIAGGSVPDERRLDLPGYPGGSDIVGNRVNGQFQLDVFGEALLLFAAAAAHDHLDSDGWRAAQIAADAIHDRWREPDAGIWEIDPDHWTHSRLTCAAGLRAISRHGPGGEAAAHRLSLADAILADTAERALHRSGRWQRSPTDPRPDAALLAPALRGALPADDSRSIATLHAIETELTEDGYCYRYRPDDRPLGQAEGAFLLCGFWLALAHGQRGDHASAVHWFERNRAACGTPGLLSEEFDVRQRQLRGNLPQAFVHALLLEAAVELAAGRAGRSVAALTSGRGGTAPARAV